MAEDGETSLLRRAVSSQPLLGPGVLPVQVPTMPEPYLRTRPLDGGRVVTVAAAVLGAALAFALGFALAVALQVHIGVQAPSPRPGVVGSLCLTINEGNVVQDVTTGAVYVLAGGSLHRIPDLQTLAALTYAPGQLPGEPTACLSLAGIGAPLPSVERSNGDVTPVLAALKQYEDGASHH